MFEASEALQKMEGMKKIKSTSFHQYSWNSEVETTWINLIGWHHETSLVQHDLIELYVCKLTFILGPSLTDTMHIACNKSHKFIIQWG